MRLLALALALAACGADPCAPPDSEARPACVEECHALGYHGPDHTVPVCQNCAWVNEGGRCVTWRLQ